MSKYSVQLRQLIEYYGRDEVESWFKDYDLADYLTGDEIAVIIKRGTWSADRLAKQIVDEYFVNEIGFETPALFKHFVKTEMAKIMEEKAPLIYSASIEYDMLVNVDYTESYQHTSKSDSTTNASGLAVNSDTPQGQISKSEILNGKYATSTGANENTAKDSTTGADEYVKRIKGNSGVTASAQKMVQQYRDNIIAINRSIIEEIGGLFMAIY